MESDLRLRKSIQIQKSGSMEHIELPKKNTGKFTSKFLKNPFKYETKCNGEQLGKIFGDAVESDSIESFKCSYVNNETLTTGRLYITSHDIFFHSPNLYPDDDDIRFQIKLHDIGNVKKDRKKSGSILEDAIRITLTNGGYFLFTNFKSLNSAYKLMKSQSLKRSDSFDTLQENLKRKTAKKNKNKSKDGASTARSSLEKEVYESDDSDTQIVLIHSNQRSVSYTSLATDQDSTENSEINENKVANNNEEEKNEEETAEEKKLRDLYTQFGKEYANFNIPMNSLGVYNFMFEKNDFFEPFWISRKFYDIVTNEWEKIGKYKTRKLEYTMEGPVVGSKFCKTTEIEKLIRYDPNGEIIIESIASQKGVPYADAFCVHSRFKISKIDSNSCNMTILAAVNFLYKPNFIAKTFIEKNCNSGLIESYGALKQRLLSEIERLNSEQSEQKVSKNPKIDEKDKKEPEQVEQQTKLNKTKTDGQPQIKKSITSKTQWNEIASKFDPNVKPVNNLTDGFKSPVYRLFFYLLLLLLLINFYLVSKLTKLENLVDKIEKCSQSCTEFQQNLI